MWYGERGGQCDGEGCQCGEKKGEELEFVAERESESVLSSRQAAAAICWAQRRKARLQQLGQDVRREGRGLGKLTLWYGIVFVRL